MNCKKINLSILLLGLMATVLVALPGCKDDENSETEKTTAEKIVGKWNVEGSYEKLNGEWVRMNDGTDIGWYYFNPDGTLEACRYIGEDEYTARMKWNVEEATGHLLIFGLNGESAEVTGIFENDDRFSFYYTTEMNPETGETRDGEFKEVLVRDKK